MATTFGKSLFTGSSGSGFLYPESIGKIDKVQEGALIIVHKKREELPFDATAFFKDAASLAASLTTIIYIINTQNN